MSKISVLTSVHLAPNPNDRNDRLEKFEQAFKSLENQTFKDFEWVLVDDGSTLDYDWSKMFNTLSSVNLVRLPHAERVIALENAMAVAKGEWFIFLDSDDELKPNALQKLNSLIEQFPNCKMFNFGAIYTHKDGNFTFRDPFTPKRKSKGHVFFGGGNIVNGTFVFHRSIYEDLGGFPAGVEGVLENIDCTPLNYGGVRNLYMNTPYDFSAAAQIEFPELRQFFMVDHEAEPHKIIKELGNPWGQDYYLFFKYTRKYHSKAVRECLYIVNPKG